MGLKLFYYIYAGLQETRLVYTYSFGQSENKYTTPIPDRDDRQEELYTTREQARTHSCVRYPFSDSRVTIGRFKEKKISIQQQDGPPEKKKIILGSRPTQETDREINPIGGPYELRRVWRVRPKGFDACLVVEEEKKN